MAKRLSSLLLFLVAVTLSSLAQTNNPAFKATVRGQVLDSLTNESIPYATLRVTTRQNQGTAVKLLATDESGKFEFVLNATDDYLLTVQFLGKSPLVKSFTVRTEDKQMDFGKLYLSDNMLLEEVVVSAFKPLVNVDLDKITYNTGDDPDSKTNNVLDMLRKVPMVTVDAEDKIELKGSSSFKIYMDGKPSNLISNNPSIVLRSMPANSIKSIEVITDPGAKYDAEGVTGIINIITNKQPMGGYTATLNAGVNDLGGYDGGVYLSAKYGKLGITGNYNYFHQNSPETEYNTYRINYTNVDHHYLNQNGTSKNNGTFQSGYGELSYEIDTLNLLSANFNLFGGSSDSRMNLGVLEQDINYNKTYSYNQSTEGEISFGSRGFNVDYQRTFRKKDELLTASYRFSESPNNNNSEIRINDAVNYPDSRRRTANDASDREHTFQLDYTTPFAKIHTLEGGAKYIIRLNESESGHQVYEPTGKQWADIVSDNDQFKYRYDILAAYLGYNLRYKDYGFKAGLRMEDTKIDVEYPLNSSKNFKTDYFTVVPSATVTYRYKMIHTFRFGYNMRVQRPGIFFLNPYVNTTDPKYISKGNPDLDVEKAHNLSLNYSVFKPKVMLNLGLNYNFMNNSIQQITTIEDDISYTTYDNIGKNSMLGMNAYVNWNITQRLRFYMNGFIGYQDIKATDDSGLGNYGFFGNAFGNLQYTLPKDFRLTVSGGGGSPRVALQGKSSGFYFNSIGINKSFLKNKLNISLAASSPFEEFRKFYSERDTQQEYYRMDNYYPARTFNLRVSYQFGEMKQQIKKAVRGIMNDDTKAGESNNSVGSQGTSGGVGQ